MPAVLALRVGVDPIPHARFGLCAELEAEVVVELLDGTDRIAEVVRGLEADIILNIQGDEPLLDPGSLDRLVAAMEADPEARMATLRQPLDESDRDDPNVVKVVADDDGRALYFSRSPIPYHRGTGETLSQDFRAALARRPGGLSGLRKHQGIYAYTRTALLALSRLEPSTLEQDEGLEQLRALQAGFRLLVVDSDFRSQAVDTPADLERVAKILTEAH